MTGKGDRNSEAEGPTISQCQPEMLSPAEDSDPASMSLHAECQEHGDLGNTGVQVTQL